MNYRFNTQKRKSDLCAIRGVYNPGLKKMNYILSSLFHGLYILFLQIPVFSSKNEKLKMDLCQMLPPDL